MEVGMFQTPFCPPERTPSDVFDWAVAQAIHADQAGFSEYWIGEHITLQWEALPNPELIIAAAARQTQTIKLGPLAHLLPYYHPATLAAQAAWLSQVLKGRYQMGVAPGAYPTDAALRGFKDLSNNHRMMTESIEIMEKIWANEPFEFTGEFWSASLPAGDAAHPIRDQRPWGGKMPMAMTGLSPNSPSIRYAGAHGYSPASVFSCDSALVDHFEIYREAAAKAGHTGSRKQHRVVRDVFIADTDAEARKLALEGGMGRAWTEYLLPTYHAFGIAEAIVAGTSYSVSDVTPEFLADHFWLVGSPETVREKMETWLDALGGGFGTLLLYSYDYIDNPAPWVESMQRLAQEVTPSLAVDAFEPA
jgi:alkanesulfonate monooxygenase SsuD/methylene tetrahydromethanopterin reductase-like flavin-dependent oxidoreductase (luciferase family)